MQILLVEDDMMLGSSLKKALELEHFSVEWVTTGQYAIEAAEANDFGAAILDINLPDCSGIEVLNAIRRSKNSDLPILLLTVIDAIDQKINALNIGADDYLTKPFDFNELLARVHAIMRRRKGKTDNILSINNLELNLNTKQLKIGSKKSYIPSASEFMVLKLLMQKPGKMISKSRIEDALYGWEGNVESNTVEVIIYNLRKKIGKEAIVTMRGVGYMIPS